MATIDKINKIKESADEILNSVDGLVDIGTLDFLETQLKDIQVDSNADADDKSEVEALKKELAEMLDYIKRLSEKYNNAVEPLVVSCFKVIEMCQKLTAYTKMQNKVFKDGYWEPDDYNKYDEVWDMVTERLNNDFGNAIDINKLKKMINDGLGTYEAEEYIESHKEELSKLDERDAIDEVTKIIKEDVLEYFTEYMGEFLDIYVPSAPGGTYDEKYDDYYPPYDSDRIWEDLYEDNIEEIEKEVKARLANDSQIQNIYKEEATRLVKEMLK